MLVGREEEEDGAACALQSNNAGFSSGFRFGMCIYVLHTYIRMYIIHTYINTYIHTYVMMCSNIQAVLLNNIYIIYMSVNSLSHL
jgi:hypothetical protein